MPTTAPMSLSGTNVASKGFPRKGKNLGDSIVFTDKITAINGAIPVGAGQHSGFCFLVREPAMWLCQAGFMLPPVTGTPFVKGGQIQAQGLMDYSGTGPPFNVQAAITGGIGDYRQAQGQIDVVETPPKSEWTLTIETP